MPRKRQRPACAKFFERNDVRQLRRVNYDFRESRKSAHRWVVPCHEALQGSPGQHRALQRPQALSSLALREGLTPSPAPSCAGPTLAR